MSDEPNPSPSGERPTTVRLLVLGVLCLLTGVLYIDRICISQALPAIRKEFDLSPQQGAYVLMAFTLAYGLFEVPTGRWGDQIGPRRVLTRISLWWSAFTALTGACWNLWSLIIVRFLFGAGEAGALPNVARVVSRWFPPEERGRVQGIILAASLIGGAISPMLAAALIGYFGWRWTFVAFGGLGVIWAAGFWSWFRDDPASHPQVNAAEIDKIGHANSAGPVHASIPWALVVRNPSVWMLGTIMTLASFNSYIYFSWFPTYLQEGRGIDPWTSGVMAALVLGFSACGTLLGGQVLDSFVTGRGNARRRMMGSLAYAGAAALIVAALLTPAPWPAALLLGCSCLLTQSTQSLWWSCAIGISGKHVGALFGLMNSAGVFGAMSSQFLAGGIAQSLKSHGYSGRAQWDPIFQIDVAVLLVGALIWASFRFVTVEAEES